MPIEDLFDHKCDIYHFVKKENLKGYGLPSETKYSYDKLPDLKDIPCHFKSVDGVAISKGNPTLNFSGDIILKLPIGTNIKQNDKVIDKETGVVYVAYIPKSVRNNHLKVKLKIDESV